VNTLAEIDDFKCRQPLLKPDHALLTVDDHARVRPQKERRQVNRDKPSSIFFIAW
jgi:hypothetical protein